MNMPRRKTEQPRLPAAAPREGAGARTPKRDAARDARCSRAATAVAARVVPPLIVLALAAAGLGDALQQARRDAAAAAQGAGRTPGT